MANFISGIWVSKEVFVLDDYGPLILMFCKSSYKILQEITKVNRYVYVRILLPHLIRHIVQLFLEKLVTGNEK